MIDLCSKKTAFNQLDASRFFFHIKKLEFWEITVTQYSIARGLNPGLLNIDGYLLCHLERSERTHLSHAKELTSSQCL